MIYLHTHFADMSKALRNEYLLKTEALFVSHKQQLLTDFAEHFQLMCAKIVELQDRSYISSISYMEYTMLYTNFISRRYIAEVWVYGDKLYSDKNQRMIGELDISLLFVHFNELCDKLISQRKYYGGKVRAREVISYIIELLPCFYSYLTNIARFAIAPYTEGVPFSYIVKNEVFMINVGEYMSKTETVYTEQRRKNADKLAEWFSKQLIGKYVCGDYTCLDFSEKTFLYTDFRYAQFRNSIFKDTVFDNSKLIGASFHKAYMEGCHLNNCFIFEADFSYAMLKNACFTNVRAKAGLIDSNNWRFVGFLPVCFRYANLTNANFTGANLVGADFTGAILTNANFTDAVLDDAIFTDTLLDDAIFS